jgi:hypothetical protein
METAAIIPTRGQERKVFSHYQRDRAKALGYDHVFVIDHPPVKGVVDIYQRVAKGVQLAWYAGADWVSIIEDDDHYTLDYLSELKRYMIPGIDLIGINRTIYYHLFKQEYRVMVHPGRSSLFTTSFRPEIFKWFPVNPSGYFDIALWASANRTRLNLRLLDTDLALGMKHGIGLCGGNGHTMNLGIRDPDLEYLKGWCDPGAFEFYKDIIFTLKPAWQQSQQSQKRR